MSKISRLLTFGHVHAQTPSPPRTHPRVAPAVLVGGPTGIPAIVTKSSRSEFPDPYMIVNRHDLPSLASTTAASNCTCEVTTVRTIHSTPRFGQLCSTLHTLGHVAHIYFSDTDFDAAATAASLSPDGDQSRLLHLPGWAVSGERRLHVHPQQQVRRP